MTMAHLDIGSVYGHNSQATKCRVGEDLAFIPGLGLVDCQKLCLEQEFQESRYADGECVLVFNFFKNTLQISSGECEAIALRMVKVSCDSVQYTPDADGAAGVCNLKYGRSGAVEACANQRTRSYDFECGDTAKSRYQK